jgi:hypothetical protein
MHRPLLQTGAFFIIRPTKRIGVLGSEKPRISSCTLTHADKLHYRKNEPDDRHSFG